MYTIYILKCADGTLYTGITHDLKKRIAMHATGKGAKYMRGRLPFSVVYTEQRKTRGAALKREHVIKKFSRAGKLKLIRHMNCEVVQY